MENKTSKYFKYAIGEIVLVVIGILIALQINTWNENRKSDEILKNYYSQILQDLKKDYNLINGRIHYLEMNIEIYKEFKENFQNQKSPKAALMATDIFNVLNNSLKFNSNTIKTLGTTGDIKLIPEDLRNNLIDLMNHQDHIISIAQANNEMFLKEMIIASRLGYNHKNRFVEKDNFDESYPLYNALHIDDNYREIALIVKAAFKFKNVNEQFQLSMLKSGKGSVNNIFTIINKELNSPYKDIESVTDDTRGLAFLYGEGKTVDEIIAIVKQQDRQNPVYNISEKEINSMGYYIMTALKLNEEALKVFKFNTEFYPEAWNTYDSYGECLLVMGDKENAIKAYRKSIELNPDNESGIEILSELELDK